MAHATRPRELATFEQAPYARSLASRGSAWRTRTPPAGMRDDAIRAATRSICCVE
jgi:hypothetical protein